MKKSKQIQYHNIKIEFILYAILLQIWIIKISFENIVGLADILYFLPILFENIL